MESGFVSMSYNALLTTQESNVGVKLVIAIMIAKSTLTCTNCGEIGHSVETCHNRKRKLPIVLTVIIKSIKHVVGIKIQLVKSRKILVHYPYIICFNVEHR
jgi:hypothetical protein